MEQAQTNITFALPRVPHRLIGRERERAAAREALLERAAPLLTLTGPGGVGKTRLALAIAAEVGEQFRDGVVWVDLARIGDPTQVAATVAGALGQPLPAAAEPVDVLARLLHPRQLLLLLDNCEHLLPTVAPLLSALLTRCPALQVLATSRASLRLRWEQVLPVRPLPTPEVDDAVAAISRNEAVHLFVERAQAVQPAFALTDANAATVAALCRQLDGLPLAIELAAARSAVLTPEAMLVQMRDRLRLLANGPRDVPPRQETIAAAIAWSYDLLDAQTQGLFRSLAVFPGGFTLEAVAWVAEGDGTRVNEGADLDLSPPAPTASYAPRSPLSSSVERLAALIDHNLVQPMTGQSEPRYSMLETVRAFALERLVTGGELGAARDSLVRSCVAQGEWWEKVLAVDPAQEDALFRWVELEQANIRTAMVRLAECGDANRVLRLCTGVLAGTWEHLLNSGEGRYWLEWGLARAPAVPTIWRSRALCALAEMLWVQTRYPEARGYADEALAIARHIDDPECIAWATHMLGNIAVSEHDWVRAVPLLEEALRRWRALGVGGGVFAGYAMQLLAGAEHGRGNNAACERFALEALAHFRAIGYETGIGGALARLGRMTREQGYDRTAALSFREELRIGLEVGSRFVRAQAFAGLGEIASRHGQAEIAAALIGAIDAIAQEGGATRVPAAGANYDRATAAAREVLGAVRFAELHAAGRKLPLDRAVALARSVALPPARLDEPVASWLAADEHASIGTAPEASLVASEPRVASSVDVAALLTAPEPTIDLTYRERDVLALLCQRWTDQEIAQHLFISPRTVSSHVSSILAKLGAANRREAAAIAVRSGLLQG